MFINDAYAQEAATQAAAASPLAGMLPLVLIFVVFYFLLIRPQQKKFKEHKTMIDAVKKGDRVLTGGGIYGVVTKVEADGELLVEIANGFSVKVARGTLAAVITPDATAEDKKKAIADAKKPVANDNQD